MITNYGNRTMGGEFTPSGIWTPPRLASTVAPLPVPTDKTDGLWGFSAHLSTITKSGTTVTAVSDPTGNGRNTSFASGKEAFYQASWTNGKPAIKLLVTTLGTFAGTTGLIDPGTNYGIYAVIQDVAEAGTYYHTFASFRAVSGTEQNLNFNVSNDPDYGVFFGIVPDALGVAIGMASTVVPILASPSAVITNYDGGTFILPASYKAWVNNTSKTVAAQVGSVSNNTKANQINSYANTSPPVFPATGCFIAEFWLYASPITPTERANIFKPYTVNTYAIAQA